MLCELLPDQLAQDPDKQEEQPGYGGAGQQGYGNPQQDPYGRGGYGGRQPPQRPGKL